MPVGRPVLRTGEEKVTGLVGQQQIVLSLVTTFLSVRSNHNMLHSLSPLLLPLLLGLTYGGCSFKNQMDENHSVNKDLDAAKFAAKMALAHKGLDIETLKKRQAR